MLCLVLLLNALVLLTVILAIDPLMSKFLVPTMNCQFFHFVTQNSEFAYSMHLLVYAENNRSYNTFKHI